MLITISFTTLKRFLCALAVASVIAAGSFAIAQAQGNEGVEDINQEAAAKIQFPVEELNGCASKEECKAYCDVPQRRNACFAFAKKHKLFKEEKIQKIEKRLQALKTEGGGPGGCLDERQCEAYCSDTTHIKECVEFARRTGIMPEEELAEAEKVLKILESGGQLPGGCLDKAQCDAYCSESEHMEECIAFAERAGFMTPDELEEVKRILPLMQSGQAPGGCRGREACELYCEDPDNIEECVAFAEKAGLILPEEAAMIRKTGGQGPGGCRGKAQCEAYCNEPDHMEACFEFAAQYGLIPPEEIEQIRKLGGPSALIQGGPGGCKGKEECEEFCGNPENQEVCFNFAAEHGLIPPEELELINAAGGLEALRSGTGFDGRGGEMMEEGHAVSGPGGCVAPEECFEYCSEPEHMEECRSFAPGAGMPAEGAFPPPDEFPGQPPQDFSPPPGFNETPPGPGEFEVPPGFVPPGAGEFYQEGDIPEEFREQFEEEFREQFEREREYRMEGAEESFSPDEGFSVPEEFAPAPDETHSSVLPAPRGFLSKVLAIAIAMLLGR